MDRTATRRPVHLTERRRRQAIRGVRASGVRPDGEPTGSVAIAFVLASAVESVTVWVQSSAGFDVLTYRHFTAATPVRRWNVTVPEMPAGTYDVTVDVPSVGNGGRESWSGTVTL